MKVIPFLFAILCLAGLIFTFALSDDTAQRNKIRAARVVDKPKIVSSLIPDGKYGRKKMLKMSPKYITIHSTQNYRRGADAANHAKALSFGSLKSRHNSLGYLTWHFSVDQKSIHQSLPATEQGQHADYEGPGNRTSIGIEMCENEGNSRQKTLAQTAHLAAWLMQEHNIPIENVVPHYHWKRIRFSDKKDIGQKPCPHFLMDDGKPGKKWEEFQAKIRSHF